MNHVLLNSSNKYSYKFLQVSSYSGTTSGKINLKLGLNKDDVANKNVLLLEDIIDSGKTVNYLNEYISSLSPKSFKIASLLVKSNNIELCDWYGFKISDKFVIGFGLDLDESFRYLKDIYIKVNNVKKENKNKITKNIISNFILWTLIIIVSLTVLNYVDVSKKTKEIPYSSFLALISDQSLNKNISSATITGNELVASCELGCFIDEENCK